MLFTAPLPFNKTYWAVIHCCGGFMFHARKFISVMLTAIALGVVTALPVQAEDPSSSTSVAAQTDPARIDRDGKRICGYELMTDSERGGHRSMLHATKVLEDRDVIRADLCKRMQKRADEKGVKLQE
jgi:hypothetical protein